VWKRIERVQGKIGLSWREIGRLMVEQGVVSNETYWTAMKAQDSKPGPEPLHALAQLGGVSVDWLLDGETSIKLPLRFDSLRAVVETHPERWSRAAIYAAQEAWASDDDPGEDYWPTSLDRFEAAFGLAASTRVPEAAGKRR
jgi:hypothetical protein